MKQILPFLGLGAVLATVLSSCSASQSSNALRSNDGIPIYAIPSGPGPVPC